MQKTLILFITFILLSIMQTTPAKELCSCECSFDTFFRENYQNLLQDLCPDDNQKKIFDMIFNAYSIKFQGLDYEYENICTSLKQSSEECIKEKEKYLKTLSTIAMDEYYSFLDDLSFETCGAEDVENHIVKKNKKRYRKALKRLIAKNCR